MVSLMIQDKHPAMPWDEIDAVVFDVGNVLLRYVPSALLEHFFPGDTQLHHRIAPRVFPSPYWTMIDRGTATLQEAAKAMAGTETDLLNPIMTLMQGWPDALPPIPEGVEALKICKAHGKKCYVLSNYLNTAFAVAQEKYDFFQLFDGIVLSSDVHLTKPDVRIYQHITDTYHLCPQRTLFLDDLHINIEAALYQGWQGYLVNDHKKLLAFFQG